MRGANLSAFGSASVYRLRRYDLWRSSMREIFLAYASRMFHGFVAISRHEGVKLPSFVQKFGI